MKHLRLASLSIAAAVTYQLLLLVLIFLRPDLPVYSTTISEWAIGKYGWLMQIAFFISAISYFLLFATLKDEIVRINLDAAGFGASKRFNGEWRFHAEDIDPFRFRIAFGVDAQLDGHAEGIDRLLDLADDAEAFWRAVDDELRCEIRHAGGIQPACGQPLRALSPVRRRAVVALLRHDWSRRRA